MIIKNLLSTKRFLPWANSNGSWIAARDSSSLDSITISDDHTTLPGFRSALGSVFEIISYTDDNAEYVIQDELASTSSPILADLLSKTAARTDTFTVASDGQTLFTMANTVDVARISECVLHYVLSYPYDTVTPGAFFFSASETVLNIRQTDIPTEIGDVFSITYFKTNA